MEHIIGILPAGGRARRIHGVFKEMMPIGINENDNAKFVVTSERILWSMLEAGAASVHFLLNSQKSFIADYYAKQEISTGRINFNYITTQIENLGMPYALDNLYDQTKGCMHVMLGLPDTVIEPPTSFKVVLDLLRSHNADLALGLYKTDSRNRGGYVTFDQDSKIVLTHVDKTSAHFPDHADNAWAVVCWSARFTEFMHSYLEPRRYSPRPIARSSSEMIFGDLIDGAIADKSMRIVADSVDQKAGFYWDISDPEKYFDLLRRYYSSGETIRVGKPPRVFIGHGHSECWKQLRDFLRDRLDLQWEEFNRISVVGRSTQSRLIEMLDGVHFAFLVMTAEEQDAVGEPRARDNVIHEIGLFQGRLGFDRAVILLEEGCKEFSNILGINQIRFPSGNVMARSDEIRQVLEREGLIR